MVGLVKSPRKLTNGRKKYKATTKSNTGKNSKGGDAKPSKRAVQKNRENEKRNGSKYLDYMLSIYTKEELKPLEEDEEGAGEGAEESGDSKIEGYFGEIGKEVESNYNQGVLLCIKDGCKRKRGGRAGPCVKNFCFLCCHESRSESNVYCPGHYAMSQQKDTEDRYIAEGLNLVKPNKTKFYHYEDKFTNYNQTVTIWCSKDFFMNKEFCGDVMADVQRAQRNKLLLKRRQGAAASSSIASTVGGPAEAWRKLNEEHRKASKERFNKIMEKFRANSGHDKDCTAYLLK